MIRTLYDNLPELSVDGLQLRLTLVSVTAVATRLVGVVGADRSPLAAELTGTLKRSPATKANTVIAIIRRERHREVMTILLLTSRLSGKRQPRFIGGVRTHGPKCLWAEFLTAREGNDRLPDLITHDYYYCDVSSLRFRRANDPTMAILLMLQFNYGVSRQPF